MLQPVLWAGLTLSFLPITILPPRFRGWPERLHLYCGKSELREHGKAICLMANAISCFLFLFLSDVFGRRGAIRINSALVLASLALAYLLEEYYYKMFFIGVAFGCEGGLGALYIILINEVSDSQSKLKSKISAYTLASFSFGIVALNMMSFFFKSADSLLLAMLFWLVAMYYPNFVVLYESPSWLLKKKQAAKAVDAFKKIAIFNSRHLPAIYFQEMQRTFEQDMLQETVEMTKIEEESRFSILFVQKQNFKPLLILSAVSIGLFCNVYAMNTSIQDMGLEPIQFNGILIGVTQAVGFLFSLRYLANTRRRHALILIQSSMILSGFLLTTLEYLSEVKFKKLCQGFVANIVISLCISAYFSFLYIVNAESFPVQVKGIAVGKLVGSLAPYISLLSRKMRVHPMVGASLPLFGSLLLTMFLKETLKPILRPHMLLGPSQTN